MKTQDWINEQKIEAVQDRKDGKDYWKTDNLYTETDLIELLEAFAIYSVRLSLPTIRDMVDEGNLRALRYPTMHEDKMKQCFIDGAKWCRETATKIAEGNEA